MLVKTLGGGPLEAVGGAGCAELAEPGGGQRRGESGVAQAGLGLIPVGEVVPELGGQAGVVTGEVAEQEQARAGLTHIADPAQVTGGYLAHGVPGR